MYKTTITLIGKASQPHGDLAGFVTFRIGEQTVTLPIKEQDDLDMFHDTVKVTEPPTGEVGQHVVEHVGGHEMMLLILDQEEMKTYQESPVNEMEGMSEESLKALKETNQ